MRSKTVPEGFKDAPSLMLFKSKTDLQKGKIENHEYPAINENNYDIIDFYKVNYDKKLLVIYNPSSGRKINIKDQIREFFKNKNIQFEFYETTGPNDGYNYIKDKLNMDDISALVISGGDGTIHEVVNGMMMRDDKKKVPVALLPNGSGNDTCRAFRLSSIE